MHYNHNELTKREEGKKLIFYKASPRTIADNVGLVLFTKYVSHDVTAGIRSRKPAHSAVLEIRDILEILASCEDLLCPVIEDGPSAAATGPPQGELRVISLEEEAQDFRVLELYTRPRSRTVDYMEHFATEFLAEAKKSKDGAVGKMSTTKLRKKHGLPQEPRQMAREGWLESVVLEGGTKVSRYKPGKKMLELAGGPRECEAPDDPVQYMQWLVAQKPSLLAQKEAVEAEMRAKMVPIATRLNDIDTAEQALANLNDRYQFLINRKKSE